MNDDRQLLPIRGTFSGFAAWVKLCTKISYDVEALV